MYHATVNHGKFVRGDIVGDWTNTEEKIVDMHRLQGAVSQKEARNGMDSA